MNKLLNKLALFLIVLSLFLFGLGFYLDNVHMTVYYPKPPKASSTHIDVVKEEIKKEGKATSRFRIDETKNIEEENKKLNAVSVKIITLYMRLKNESVKGEKDG